MTGFEQENEAKLSTHAGRSSLSQLKKSFFAWEETGSQTQNLHFKHLTSPSKKGSNF